MALKHLRKKKLLSQEQLAEHSGISLRTIQRIEKGERVSEISLKTLADSLNSDITSLYQNEKTKESNLERKSALPISAHLSAQIIILFVTYFICVTQWYAFYSRTNPAPVDMSLGKTLLYLLQITLVFSVFAYAFYAAKKVFISGYYITTALFVFTAIALNVWTGEQNDSVSYQLFFPVYSTLMLLSLVAIHMVQLALSLKDEAKSSLTTH